MDTDYSPHKPPDATTEFPGRQMVEVIQPGQLAQAAIMSVHSELAISDVLPGLQLHEPTALFT